ncbi:MAG: hypothetical protein AABW89_06015 [Nanoarchaeota archaeon]
MSQSSKHVEWCLSKAKKEIEECARLNKRLKHRGLIKSNPNVQQSQNHLKKAEENLQFAVSLDSSRYGYKVIESIFYSIYQCFLSIAMKFGYESANQTCTISLMEYLKEQNKINLDQKFVEMMRYKDEQKEQEYTSIIDMREEYTYSAKVSVEKEKIDELILVCQELIEKTKEIIYSKES